MNSWTILASLLALCVGNALAATSCYTSNDGTRNWDDDGKQTECRDVAGATLRYCLKFSSESRPGKIFRECDHVYENLFGENTFKHEGEGCWDYETKIGDIEEKGKFCACKDENCNGGNVPDEELIALMPVEEGEEPAEGV